MDAADCSVTVGPRRTRIDCPINRGHLTLLTAAPEPSSMAARSACYTRTNMALVHSEVGHAAVSTTFGAFPPHKLKASDVTYLKDVSKFCVPCQTQAHLPRRPRYALPQRPLVFNRVVAMDVFQLTPSLSKVLDITCLDTDFGQGSFVPSMRGEIIFSIFYLVWLAIWGCMESILTDRGSENENDALIKAINSMGIHWRAAPTEAPSSISRNERHHCAIRDAFLRIMSETPLLVPEMALAIAY